MASQGHTRLYNYIDDLVYIGLPDEIHKAYNYLLNLLQQLGLDISQEKLVPPTTTLICLGIKVDVVHKIISIPKKNCNKYIMNAKLGLVERPAIRDNCNPY